jgi:hypothetical protein
MPADGLGTMATLQPITLAPKTKDPTPRFGSSRLGVAILLIGIVGTIGWIGLLGLVLIRLALLAVS